MDQKTKSPTIEEILQRLETLVNQMESEGVTLNESLKLVREGLSCIQKGQKIIKDAKKSFEAAFQEFKKS